MKRNFNFHGFIVASLILLFASNVWAQNNNYVAKEIEEARTNAYEKQLEDYLKHFLVDEYEARSAAAWNRDYSSPEALVKSVAPNRKRWEEVLSPPVLSKSGPLVRKPYPLREIQAEWIELPLGMITAQAVLAFPEGASEKNQVPIIIVQHGIGSTPESPFSPGGYHEYAKGLLKAGFAVLVPLNLRSIERRNNIERYARLAGTSLPGIELVRVQNLLDVVLEDPRVDEDRVGMWGVSLGGMATMFWMPLESRIKAGVVSGWFNERRNKMAVADERYSSFAPREEHAFFDGWLTEFSDYDVVSLIAPRPLMLQHGKKDNIAYWPQVVEEYNKAAVHYQKLNIPEKIELTLHEGGHEAIVEDGVRFLRRWLREADQQTALRKSEIIACGEDQVMIIDGRTSNGRNLDVVWRWKVSEANDLPESHRKYMTSIDDCKSIDGNRKILISSSHGGVVLVDRATKKTLFYAKAPNAHSIEYLPNNRIAVANSTGKGGNSIEIYDANKSDVVLFKDSLYSGHGVTWMAARKTLYALGYDELRAYSLKNWDKKRPSLVLLKKWTLPDTGGHDLTIVSDNNLVLTTTRGVWNFDIDGEIFTPFELLQGFRNVKSVNYNDTTRELVYTKGETSWWTEHIYFRNPDKMLVLPDLKLYKVRVVQE